MLMRIGVSGCRRRCQGATSSQGRSPTRPAAALTAPQPSARCRTRPPSSVSPCLPLHCPYPLLLYSLLLCTDSHIKLSLHVTCRDASLLISQAPPLHLSSLSLGTCTICRPGRRRERLAGCPRGAGPLRGILRRLRAAQQHAGAARLQRLRQRRHTFRSPVIHRRWRRRPGAASAAPGGQWQPGAGLRPVATRPPPGPSRPGGAGGGRSHERTGSFSESLDILAARLGLSGPMGHNGQPTLAGAPQPPRPPPLQPPPEQARRSDWTFNNMAWNLPPQPGMPANPASPQQRSPQQRQPEDPASVQYIQRLKASEGAAFVSSTQEWKRRALSPAADPQQQQQQQNGRGGGYAYSNGHAGPQQGGRSPQNPTASPTRRPTSPRVSNGWAPRQPAVAQVGSPPWLQSREQREATAQPPQPLPPRDPFAASQGLPPAAGPPPYNNPFHSTGAGLAAPKSPARLWAWHAPLLALRRSIAFGGRLSRMVLALPRSRLWHLGPHANCSISLCCAAKLCVVCEPALHLLIRCPRTKLPRC